MSCVYLDAFWMQTWPVTVADYQTFIDAGGYRESAWWDADGWQWCAAAEICSPREWQQMASRRNRPVTGVSWWEARAYCRWLTSKDTQLKAGWQVHLPTEAQWEKAARGAATDAGDAALSEPHRFPWGSVWYPDRANWSGSLPISELAPVGLFPAGHSPFGVWDMAGNIAERCLDGFAPYDPAATRNPLCLDYRFGHTVRGGAYDSPPLDLRVTYRFGDAPDHQDPRIGFRCAATPGEALDAMVSTGTRKPDAARA
jgi:iron(II)-dependent oxidoreductase